MTPGAGGGRSPRGRLAAGFAVVTVVAGAGLLVFADPAWAHAIGAVALIACAVTVFALASGPAAELAGRFVEVAFPRLVVFTWGFADDEAASRTRGARVASRAAPVPLPGGSTRVTVTFREADGGTLLHAAAREPAQ